MATKNGAERASYALIVGAGSGLSAALARRAARAGMVPLLAARNPEAVGRDR